MLKARHGCIYQPVFSILGRQTGFRGLLAIQFGWNDKLNFVRRLCLKSKVESNSGIQWFLASRQICVHVLAHMHVCMYIPHQKEEERETDMSNIHHEFSLLPIWALKCDLYYYGHPAERISSCIESQVAFDIRRMVFILTEPRVLLAIVGRATGKDTGVGGVTAIWPTGSLATSILTEFPQFLSTWATCSLVIPCTFVPPIFKMWSPVCSLPSFGARKKKQIIQRNLWFSLIA